MVLRVAESRWRGDLGQAVVDGTIDGMQERLTYHAEGEVTNAGEAGKGTDDVMTDER